MDLEELSAFIAVVESGSFLAAASRLGISRTTLRRRVGSLESRVGVSLLEGTHRGIVLTDAGQGLATHGRKVIQEMRVLLASIREAAEEPTGILRAVLPVGLPPHLLVPIFSSMRQAFPRLHIHVRLSNDPLNESLMDTDLIVHMGEKFPEGPWLSYVVFRVRQWLVASRAYLEKHPAPRTPEELVDHDLLVWQGPGTNPLVLPRRGAPPMPISPVMINTDIHAIRQCCLSGLGIGYVPDALLPDPGADDVLVPLFVDEIGAEWPLRITVPTALSQNPKISMVLDRIKGFLGVL
ncbi:MAG: LysR family transcriptional regulator [Polyangiaceae bacterium]